MISGAIPAKFRGIPRNFAEFRRNCAEITSEVKKFRGIPCRRNSVDTLSRRLAIEGDGMGREKHVIRGEKYTSERERKGRASEGGNW